MVHAPLTVFNELIGMKMDRLDDFLKA